MFLNQTLDGLITVGHQGEELGVVASLDYPMPNTVVMEMHGILDPHLLSRSPLTLHSQLVARCLVRKHHHTLLCALGAVRALSEKAHLPLIPYMEHISLLETPEMHLETEIVLESICFVRTAHVRAEVFREPDGLVQREEVVADQTEVARGEVLHLDRL